MGQVTPAVRWNIPGDVSLALRPGKGLGEGGLLSLAPHALNLVKELVC
jgi:hypothetical protein